eukprot:534984_1
MGNTQQNVASMFIIRQSAQSIRNSLSTVAVNHTDKYKGNDWQCIACGMIQSISFSVCIMCGHHKSLRLKDEYQCEKCRLIQTPTSAKCTCCGLKNYYVRDQKLTLIDIDGSESPMWCRDRSVCIVCDEECKVDKSGMRWNCYQDAVCNECYVAKSSQVPHSALLGCNLKRCHHLKRYVLRMNSCCKFTMRGYSDHNGHFKYSIFKQDFEHLKNYHARDQEFEYIIDKLNSCSRQTCPLYIAYSSGNTEFDKVEKLHLYFQHRGGIISGKETAILKVLKGVCMICRMKSMREQVLWKSDYGYVCDKCYGVVRQSLKTDSGKCELLKCYQFQRLELHIKRYNESYGRFTNYQDTTRILNDYLHLFLQHDSDEDFEFISQRLGECNLLKCSSFIRNNRNRARNSFYNNQRKVEVEAAVYTQLLDKIHCSFQHCFDIGDRLTIKQKRDISMNMKEDEKECINDFLNAGHSLNKSTLKINKLVQRKMNLYGQCVTNRRNNKYNNLFEPNTNDDAIYKFGYLFNYDGENEQKYDSIELHDYTSAIDIKPKYMSFKDELINSKIHHVTIEQYNCEYTKASVYRKLRYKHFLFYNYKQMRLQFILSLMFYSNFDRLQYEFSKTYRENNGKYHVNFYYFGKYLKHAVHQFGHKMRGKSCCGGLHAEIKGLDEIKYYHGVSKLLTFPSYGTNSSRSHQTLVHYGYYGFHINGPLSTSSSLPVAVHFATTSGLLIEFEDSSARYVSSSRFDMSWLSDYPNEKENLFIQTPYRFRIESITEVSSGADYKIILRALRLLHLDIDENDESDRIRKLVSDALISNQLSKTYPHEYNAFKTLYKYGETICRTHFNGIKEYSFKYLQWDHLKFWKHDKTCIWIRIRLIRALFPNIEIIHVTVNHFSAVMLDNLLLCLEKKKGNNQKLIFWIHIKYPVKKLIDYTIRQRRIILTQNNVLLWSGFGIHKFHKFDAKICVFKMCRLKAALYLMDISQKYYSGLLYPDMTVANKIVSKIKRLSNKIECSEQETFRKYCVNKTFICIDFGSQFNWFNVFGTNNDWDMKLMDRTFPNIISLQVLNSDLDESALHYYSKLLMNSTKLKRITLVDKGTFVTNLRLSEYEVKKYNGLDYRFECRAELNILKGLNIYSVNDTVWSKYSVYR